MALDYLEKVGESRRTLIICPASIMNVVWKNDIETTLRGTTVGLLRGTKQQRLKELNKGYRYNVINYEGLEVISNELEDLVFAGKIRKIVIDELTAYGHASTRR
jgi:hypothetical protein